LISLLLPGVQSARESARRSECLNNLKNIGLALTNYHSSRKCFPAGNDSMTGTEQAWSARILPFLETAAVAQKIDYRLPWDAPGVNLQTADIDISIYVCPSALIPRKGKQDYGGLMGTALAGLPPTMGPEGAFGCGTLITTNPLQPKPVSAARITDGLSHTIAVGESVDRDDEVAGRWACGRNCFSQNEPYVNLNDSGSLHSFHPGGAQVLYADGHVQMLIDDTATSVLSALCTRNGGDQVTTAQPN